MLGVSLDFPTHFHRECFTDAWSSYDWECTYTGTSYATQDDLNRATDSFCAAVDDATVSGGMWRNATYQAPSDGQPIFLGVHNYAANGSSQLTLELCTTGFYDILQRREPSGAGAGTRGGYIIMYFKFLTFVIGVDGNMPTPFCGGYC
ncbi:hypothetical protein BAUCODRAFT_30102 [Baudoinia panamericana UAMH 10762]|uniref:Uncharacterized protein n=1 Tax=Baudoinia panamericana (strain UAMH 10762) TaxID=717646 RepID=M2LYD5_BAUPA|nr:uncharacterized protein BAUCODRAFT_30102 [Baudoinia panamericana UAMH 10762]EMC99722.1 hypothetical protein BAUCODRAFT_30102 [Baudoinia panamericana UAMH 10762]